MRQTRFCGLYFARLRLGLAMLRGSLVTLDPFLTAVESAVGGQHSLCFHWWLADCKSAIVGSTPTGASQQKTPLIQR